MHRSLRTSLATAVALALLVTLVLGGCFRLVEHTTYAIGFERTRANLVVHTQPTRALHELGQRSGSRAARQVILAATPTAFPISSRQRLVLCTMSRLLCLSAPRLGRLLVGWFRSDVANRGDFWEALSTASRGTRCFAWTAFPGRNLTHKGTGTSGCATGALR